MPTPLFATLDVANDEGIADVCAGNNVGGRNRESMRNRSQRRLDMQGDARERLTDGAILRTCYGGSAQRATRSDGRLQELASTAVPGTRPNQEGPCGRT
jgi:hypothetical protein